MQERWRMNEWLVGKSESVNDYEGILAAAVDGVDGVYCVRVECRQISIERRLQLMNVCNKWDFFGPDAVVIVAMRSK